MTIISNQQNKRGLPTLVAISRSNQQLWWWVAVNLIVVITVLHYITDMHAVVFHNVYRRIYYIPIVLGGFTYGVKGGVGAAILASVLYIPHAFFMTHGDPSPAIDKILEMVLYIGIGGLTGWFVNRQNAIREALERSLAERDALRESLVRAGKLNALGELTAGLVHEIRNPLAAIMGSAETLVVEFEPTHRKYRMGQLLLEEIDRLNRVVSDFLKFARPGAPQREAVDPVKLAREVCELSIEQARELSISVDDFLGDSVTAVWADADQVRQVILNFFLNAYQVLGKSSGENGISPRIELVREERDVGGQRYFCLGVRDNGPGVPDGLRDKIFDPYFTTRLDGTGLGLSVSSRIAEAHGGFIDVTDAVPGATFWLCLPQGTP